MFAANRQRLTVNLKSNCEDNHKQYTISQRSIHAQLNSGMGTNVGQRGLSQTQGRS